MVIISSLLSKLEMCNPTQTFNNNSASGPIHRGSKREQHTGRNADHHCIFKILKCSSQQLCILCFLLYYFAVGSCAAAVNGTRPLETTPQPPSIGDVQCFGDYCYLKIKSSEEALKKMAAVSEQLFDSYAVTNHTKRSVNEESLEQFMNDLGMFKDDHEGHNHGDHEGHDHGDHEGHDHGDFHILTDDEFYDYADFYSDSLPSNNEFVPEKDNETKSRKKRSEDTDLPCMSSVKDLVREYFHPKASNDFQLSLGDFMALMPEILLNIKRPECRMEKEYNHDEGSEESEGKGGEEKIEHSTANVWLISFGSVLIISLVSLLGVLLIPLLRHSHVLNQVIGFLVALAVGTLAGDALLHLLPHASGLHNHGDKGHEGHNHGNEGKDEDHFDSMWKGLVACVGIYFFYVLETVMGFIHKKKTSKKHRHHHHSHTNNHHDHLCEPDTPSSTSSPSSKTTTKVKDSTVIYSPCESPLLKIHSPTPNGKIGNGHIMNGDSTVIYPPCESPLLKFHSPTPNGKIGNGHIMNGDANKALLSPVPVVAVNGHLHHDSHEHNGHLHHDGHQHNGHIKSNDHKIVIDMDEEPLETGHHHHHSHEVPKTIASLAWMVIVGDGLHNITDGLAIGAAFTSGIGAGLSTSLAIFFHEIPQELGDFAILLNSGMSVKQALLCNFLSACTCFVGLVIGLLVGEYTNGIILWVLAFTAGSFLYIALVDMLPAMMKQLDHKEYKKRFVIQNLGLLSGYALMVTIALHEGTIANSF